MEVKLIIKNPMLRQYLKSTSHQTAAGYKVSSRTATGLLICSLARISHHPLKEKKTPETIDIILPINDITMSLRSKFIYISPIDQVAIEAILAKQFDIDFLGFIQEARSAGKTNKEGVEMFITKYHLEDIQVAFGTLIKKRYRSAIYATRYFGEKLVKKAEHDARKPRSRSRKIIY